MSTYNTLEMRSATVADIALKIPQAIDILNYYNLDYCCNGKKGFVEVCRKAHLNPIEVWEEEIMEKQSLPSTDLRTKFSHWEPALLIDFIVQNHHAYVRQSIPQIQELLNKVCTIHSAEHPELFDTQTIFDQIAEELLNHLPKEEVILFPAIRRITDRTMPTQEDVILLNVMEPVSVMEDEHEAVGSLIKLIRSLTNHYTPPALACLSFQHTYKLLKEFDQDLMQHIHIENNILFPLVKSFAE